MLTALLWKEYQEQRHRWVPVTVLLSGMMFLLAFSRMFLAAEIAMHVGLILGPLLTIILVLGPLPSEHSRGTIHFLRAQPVPWQHIVFSKWIIGQLSIVCMFACALLSGLLAGWYVGLRGQGQWHMNALCFVVTLSAFYTLYTLLISMWPLTVNELRAVLDAIFVLSVMFLWSIADPGVSLVADVINTLNPGAPLRYLVSTYQHMAQNPNDTEPIPATLWGSWELWKALISTLVIWIAVPGLCLWWPVRKTA